MKLYLKRPNPARKKMRRRMIIAIFILMIGIIFFLLVTQKVHHSQKPDLRYSLPVIERHQT